MAKQRRKSLLIDRIHATDDGTPLCGWDNVPDKRWAHRYVTLPYCGACLLVQLHSGDYTPPDPAPWLSVEPDGCRPPDWTAGPLLSPR